MGIIGIGGTDHRGKKGNNSSFIYNEGYGNSSELPLFNLGRFECGS